MSELNQHIAIIIPAFNEAQSISLVVNDLIELNKDLESTPYVIDQIIVCNNSSSDGTGEIARRAGATVINEYQRGYGAACLAGIRYLDKRPLARPDIVVFVDGDRSVDVNEMPSLLTTLTDGADLVVGVRAKELMQEGSMGRHQQFGTWLASSLIRKIWRAPVSDLGPFRAMDYGRLRQLNMQDRTFGWTTEMQVKALQAKMTYAEVPVSSLRRIGQSKISGTIKGTIGAAIGIFRMIFKLYQQESEFVESLKPNKSVSSSAFSKLRY